MKMVILGAGASFDSIIIPEKSNSDKINWRPPLGKQLFDFRPEFDNILKKFPGAESFRSEINICKDIEELFQTKYELSQKSNGAGLFMKIINVQFYLQDLFHNISQEYVDFGPSNYDILISRANDYFIKTKKQVLFVTFNYDTLLEKSIEKVCNTTFNNINDYTKHYLKVIKPHSSCNWFKRIRMDDNIIFSLIKEKGLSKYMYDNINATCNNKLWRVDNGSSGAFHHFDDQFKSYGKMDTLRRAQVLEILNDKDIKVLK